MSTRHTNLKHGKKSGKYITISITRSCPVAKMIAFGGVATGNVKANDATSVDGTINNSGLTFKL